MPDYKTIKIDGESCEEKGLKLVSLYIPMPEAKSNYIEIPGGDGALDLTEFSGGVKYSNREGLQFVFDYLGDYAKWQSAIQSFAQKVHGKKCRVVLEQDADFYYLTRLSIDPQKTNEVYGTVTLTGTADPYKYKLTETVKSFEVAGELAASLPNLFRPVVPVIEADAAMQIVFGGQTISVSPGALQVPDLVLPAGENPVTLKGTGNITFTYQEATL